MIVCFSGTGNSRWVAERLAERLDDQVVMIDRRVYDRDSLEVSGRVVWVFPIYSWGVPPVVRKVISGVRGEAEHWMVATCGDDAGLADRMWRRDLERVGGTTRGVWTVQMPNTYVTMKGFDVDPVDVAEAKVAAAGPRVEEIAGKMLNGEVVTDVVRGSFAWIKTRIIYPWFVRHAMSPRGFGSSDACTGCGKCARSCPLSNIVLKERRPSWGTVCAFCLECYHVCPTHAVTYGSSTRSKGQYSGCW